MSAHLRQPGDPTADGRRRTMRRPVTVWGSWTDQTTQSGISQEKKLLPAGRRPRQPSLNPTTGPPQNRRAHAILAPWKSYQAMPRALAVNSHVVHEPDLETTRHKNPKTTAENLANLQCLPRHFEGPWPRSWLAGAGWWRCRMRADDQLNQVAPSPTVNHKQDASVHSGVVAQAPRDHRLRRSGCASRRGQ